MYKMVREQGVSALRERRGLNLLGGLEIKALCGKVITEPRLMI